jgi:hypothetical protein
MVTLSAGGKSGIHQSDWLQASSVSGNENSLPSFMMIGY